MELPQVLDRKDVYPDLTLIARVGTLWPARQGLVLVLNRTEEGFDSCLEFIKGLASEDGERHEISRVVLPVVFKERLPYVN